MPLRFARGLGRPSQVQRRRRTLRGVSMQVGGVRRAFCAPTRLSRLRLSRWIGAALIAAFTAGCSSQQAARLTPISTAAVPNATITFESIDGPPPEVFRKLVASRNDEAASRQVPVVPRQAAATYRVRGYVTALADRDKTAFAWVWDIYDTDKHRALRITGEEPGAARHGRDAWTAADEQVLRGISRAGMERIATFLNAPNQAPGQTPGEPPAPGPLLPTLVSTDDSPEAAGIFRIFNGSAPQTPPPSDPQAEPGKPAPEAAPKAAPAKRRSAAAKPKTEPAAEPPTRSAALD